ncbi:DNA/RNA helicase domain-containing protein [Luteimonas salinilitoris]|uniref:DNA/RNA helicase domain-containing protein n=1 Tax=Luteimonas salinilitoris TaxID=3237697 RepID=A0ABV4HKB4_9GAMM
MDIKLQMVTLSDIGHTAELERWARQLGAHVIRLELSSQFRCSGSDGYLLGHRILSQASIPVDRRESH